MPIVGLDKLLDYQLPLMKTLKNFMCNDISTLINKWKSVSVYCSSSHFVLFYAFHLFTHRKQHRKLKISESRNS